jgi:hypothetical protein
VQQQFAVAAASGIDTASGSVTDARQLAQQEADRQIAITRSGIDMNAALRRGRAAYLTDAANVTREVGTVGAVAKVGNAALGYGKL